MFFNAPLEKSPASELLGILAKIHPDWPAVDLMNQNL